MRLIILILTFNALLFTQLLGQMVSRPSIPFKVPENKLNYSNVQNWYAYGKIDTLEQFLPDELREVNRERKKASAFYVHSTTYWGDNWNPRRKSIPQERVKNLLIINQAAAFSACCEVFAPHYRQAHLYSFWDIQGDGLKAFRVAYQDIKDAFEEFININGDKPFILAGHSQGTALLSRLIIEFETKKYFTDNLITAYLVGFNIKEDQFKNVQSCKSAIDAGCYLSWNTTMENTKPIYSDSGLACHNPLNWEDRKALTSFGNSNGSMPFKSYLYSNLIEEKDRQLVKVSGSAECKDGSLFILNSPLKRFPDRQMNLHAYDYAIFFKSILLNSMARVDTFHQ